MRKVYHYSLLLLLIVFPIGILQAQNEKSPENSPVEELNDDKKLSADIENTSTADEVLIADVFDGIEKDKFSSFSESGIKKKAGIFPYRLNYVLPESYTAPSYTNSANFGDYPHEVKYQLSFYLEGFKLGKFQLDFFYTQRSFFQLFDLKNSSPFRENNYLPGFLFRSPVINNYFSDSLFFDLGYIHESNGQYINDSRSWDRAFLSSHFYFGNLNVEFMLWYRLPEKEKRFEGDAFGDDNPDIYRYNGYSQIFVRYESGKHLYDAWIRPNISFGLTAFEFNYGYKVDFADFRVGVHLYSGYGESMIDYNKYRNRVGLAIILLE